MWLGRRLIKGGRGGDIRLNSTGQKPHIIARDLNCSEPGTYLLPIIRIDQIHYARNRFDKQKMEKPQQPLAIQLNRALTQPSTVTNKKNKKPPYNQDRKSVV